MKPTRLLFYLLFWAGITTSHAMQAQVLLQAADASFCLINGQSLSQQDLPVWLADSTINYSISIDSESTYFYVTLNADQSLEISSPYGFPGIVEYISYTACLDSGAICDTGIITLTYAEVEDIELPLPTVFNLEVNAGSTQEICGGLGWALANNCIPNLYTVCMTHNESLGTLTYINDDCILYEPLAMGIDTIRLVGCGDAPPSTYMTCHGPVSLSNCSETHYIVKILEDNLAGFTEHIFLNCASTAVIDHLGYPTWVTPTIIGFPLHGTATIHPDGQQLWSELHYAASLGYAGTDTVIVECAHATQITCETGTYIFHIVCGTSPLHYYYDMVCDSLTALGQYSGSFGMPPQLIIPPVHGNALIEGTLISYIANQGFSGADSFYVSNVDVSPVDEGLYGWFHLSIDCPNGISEREDWESDLRHHFTEEGLLLYSSPISKYQEIQIVDIKGRALLRRSLLPGSQLMVSTSHWPAGIYFLSSYGEGEMKTDKLRISR